MTSTASREAVHQSAGATGPVRRPALASWPGALAAGSALLVVSAFVALCVGSRFIAPADVWLSWSDTDSLTYVSVWELRAPRVAVAACAGAMFAVAGWLLQRSLNNPLAVPELLGVSSGAACAVAVSVVWMPLPHSAFLPVLAAAGALVGGSITVLLSANAVGRGGVLLVGAACSSAFMAVTMTVMSLAERLQLQALLRYIAGDLADLYWPEARVVAVGSVVCLVAALVVSPWAQLLAVGAEAARAVGVPVGLARTMMLLIAALCVAVPTAFTGPIAWVGFFAPQAVARWGAHMSGVVSMVWAGVLGAVFVIAGDMLARVVFAPIETPLGAWTAGTSLVGYVVCRVVTRRARVRRAAS